MKKLLLMVSLFLAWVPAAAQEKEDAGPPDDGQHAQMCVSPEPKGNPYWLSADPNKLWKNGSVLKVRFVQGTAFAQGKVRKYAPEWSKYANLTFDFGDHQDAQIRVAFKEGSSHSYVGKDALAIKSADATMNFGWVNKGSTEEQIRRVILHEFGHAIGLTHEHQSPSAAGIPWDKEKLYAHFKKANDWTPEQVEKAIVDIEKDSTNFTKFDHYSIMAYGIPKGLAKSTFWTPWNNSLSEQDKKHVQLLYPKSDAKVTIKCTITNQTQDNVAFTLHGGGGEFSLKPGEREIYTVWRIGAAPWIQIKQPTIEFKTGPINDKSTPFSKAPPKATKVTPPDVMFVLSDRDFMLKKVGRRYVLE